jgi:hypothetical protein
MQHPATVETSQDVHMGFTEAFASGGYHFFVTFLYLLSLFVTTLPIASTVSGCIFLFPGSVKRGSTFGNHGAPSQCFRISPSPHVRLIYKAESSAFENSARVMSRAAAKRCL